jgi:hypothetical protein
MNFILVPVTASVSSPPVAVGPNSVLRVVLGPVDPIDYILAQLGKLLFTTSQVFQFLFGFFLHLGYFYFGSSPFCMIQWRGRDLGYFTFVLKYFPRKSL